MITHLPVERLSEFYRWPSEIVRWWYISVKWSNIMLIWLFGWVGVLWTKLRVYWKISKLPGPPAKFLLGHADTFLSMDKFMDKVIKWQEKFPLCQKAYMMFYPLVFVYSPEAVQEILGKRQKHNDKGGVYHTMIPLLGDGLITSKGKKWFSRRRMITPTFHFSILESFYEIFKSRTRDFIKELKASDICNNHIDICPYTSRLTLSFICETAMGLPIGIKKSEQYEVIKAMHKLEEIGVYRCIYPWLMNDWIYKWTKAYKVQEHNKHKLHKFTDQIIRRRRQELIKYYTHGEQYNGQKKKPILIDLLIEQSVNGEALTDQEIREEVNTFMFAGHNTTQLAINYCIYLLGCYPEIQEKAIYEVDTVFGDSDRDPTMDDLKELNYLECCIKDALRLYPSVPLILRKISEDQPIGEYTIPKGVDCVILPYVIHRNPNQFPNPEEFNPENFMPENAQHRHPYSYIPFSAGPRNCIGKKFANLAEKIVISWVLREFRIQSLKRQDELKLLPSTVLVPIGGLQVKLIPRKI